MASIVDEYARARKLGRKQVEEALADDIFPYLSALEDLIGVRGGAGEILLGVMEIPVRLVAGTLTHGRQNVFSHGFLPIAEPGTEFSTKWERLYQSQVDEGIREPITVYEYLQRFYVSEGNKRVSVARFVGMPCIEARVSRILPERGSDAAELYDEFLRFWSVCPVYGLPFSKPGSFAKLAKLLGQTLDEPWSDDLVRRLRGAVALFDHAFEGMAVAGDLDAADAFLVYVEAYATLDPLGVGEREMAARIDDILDELTVAAQPEPIAYASEIPEAKGVVTSIKTLTRAVVGEKPVHVAFIYDRSPQTSGWVASHERGRLALERAVGDAVRTGVFADCADEGAFSKAVDTAIEGGADLMVTVSPRQFEQAKRAAATHPKARVINCSINLPSALVRTFYGRMYEVKFVLGALAACVATNHRIGYAAMSPVYGSVSEVNSFALGVAMVDPTATVHLEWVSSDAHDWLQALSDARASVISGVDCPDPNGGDVPSGLCRVGDDGVFEQVAMPIWDWGRLYELVVRSLRDDSWGKDAKVAGDKARNYWPGMRAGVVRLVVADSIPEGQRRLVETLSHAVENGDLAPFDVALVDQDGAVRRHSDDPYPSDEELATMRWLCSNVVGSLPRQEELSEEGLREVEVSGVIPTELNPRGE